MLHQLEELIEGLVIKRPSKFIKTPYVADVLINENQVVNRCLTSAEDMLGLREIMDHGQQQLMNEFQRQPNKREDTYNRMAEREMVGAKRDESFFLTK